ncbi:MAG TPA: hypothetical protein VHZ30_04380 [Verrucomicrobiae bacterium]|jgi:hypothetical protein|nr:hypothetical protein [Verrucomicrobiae bacterium]
MRKIQPAWFLFFFAPLTVEYVSGSSQYLNPFVHVANLLLYGTGTILIREARVRWRVGWLAVFILAVAYVIAEEGLMLNTLFDPTKNNTGRLWGVNWVWTTGMLVVHSLISIFVPILFVEAIYPKRANDSWITPRTIAILLALFCANVFGLGRLIAPYNRPDAVHYAVEFAIIGVCLVLAHSADVWNAEASATSTIRTPRWLFIASFVGILIVMVAGVALPSIPISPGLIIAVILAIYAAFLGFLHRIRAFDRNLDPLAKFAITAGMISFFIVVSPLISLGKHNPGSVICGVVVVVILLRQHKRLKRALAGNNPV